MIPRKSSIVVLALLLIPCVGWPARFPEPETIARAPFRQDRDGSGRARPCVRHLSHRSSLCGHDHSSAPRLFSWDDAEDPDAPTDLRRALLGVTGLPSARWEPPACWSEPVPAPSPPAPSPRRPRIIALRC